MILSIIIWHNPRCSKSRQTLQLLQERGINPTVVEYLKTPPSTEQITEILKKLNLSAGQMVRKSESVYRENAIADIDSEEGLIEAMRNYPILIERPIVINGDRAAVGRPPESVLSIL